MTGAPEKASAAVGTAKLEAGGNYSFFCTFPGHISMEKGKVIVK